MGASHSKSQSTKQQRKSALKATKATKSNKKITLRPQSPPPYPTPSPTATAMTRTGHVESAASHCPSTEKRNSSITNPSSVRALDNDNDNGSNDEIVSIGIDLYTSGATPSILIRDHIANRPLSSLFPTDIPLSETLLGHQNQSTLTTTYSSSLNSSTVSTLSDLFSTASIETPHSTISSRISTATTKQRLDDYDNHVPSFGDGGGPSFVTRLNEEARSTLTQLVHVAQSKISSGNDNDDSSLISQGFNDLLTLAESHHCVEAYYPLAECYYLGYHQQQQPSSSPDTTKAHHWFSKVVSTTSSSLPLSTIAWAQYRLALLLVKTPANVQQALGYFEQSADNDNRYAQYMLGLHYQHGLFMQISPDLKRALHWFERAARNGFADAQVSLAQLILENLSILMESTGSQMQMKWTHLAIHWLELASKQKNVKAHVMLGGLYDEGDVVPRNPTQAMHHYEAATVIDSNDPQVTLAHYFVGINYRLGSLVPQNIAKAKTHLELASRGEYAPAQRALGLIYLEQDKTAGSLGYEWLTKAAMQGDIQALGLLGQQAERSASEAAAIHMYKQAAQAGSVAAQLSLATLLLRIKGRRAEAFPWFQLAATNTNALTSSSVGHTRQRNVARLMVARYKLNGWDGTPIDRRWAYNELLHLSDIEQLVEAHFWVAACYNEGVQEDDGSMVVHCDSKKAFDYYMKSALGGDLDGQFQVALMLANGAPPAIKKDAVRAFKWYLKSAERGHATAQYSVGLFYERGLVEPASMEKAKVWYERASQQQHTTAMISLAHLLLQHEPGIPQHQEAALHWLHKAATKHDDKNYTAALRSLAGVFEQGKIEVAHSDPDRYQKGWLLLQKAADKQDPLAWVDMARYHEGGLGVEKSLDKALQCLVQAETFGYQKARMAMGDLHYRHKMWDKALASYDSVVQSNALLKKPGWNARLAIARLVLIDAQDSDSVPWRQEIYDWLATMTDQPATDDLLMEPLELFGLCHQLGKGATKDLTKALGYYRRVSNVSTTNKMNWIQERTRFRAIEIYMENSNTYSLAWEQLLVTKTHFSIMNHQCKSSRTLARTARFYIGFLLLHWDDLKPRSNEAHKWLAQAADEGDGDAALELAQHLLQSTNYTDTESAKQRLEQGVSASHSGCMIALALLLERTDKHSSTSDRMELLDRAIELDNTTALYHYGRLMYDTYLDAANDDPPPAHLVDRALDYYMKAATKGDRRSMMRIGQVYDSLAHYEDAQIWFEQSPCELFSDVMLIKYHLQGFVQDGVMLHGKKLSVYTLTDLCDKVEVLWLQVETLEDRMDRYTASQLSLFMAQHSEEATTCERWYLRSMEMAPSKESMYGLGQLCERRGDLEAAMDYYRSAAERWNDAESQYQLGLYHAQGLGGVETVNLVAAQRYLKLAASQGLEVAKEKLGSVMLSHARDLWHQQHQYQRALKQYEQAAALAPEALVELGHLYHTGFSSNSHGSFCVIVKSYKQAFSYYSEAARQGNPKAALMLGSYYEEGYLADMEENLEEALHWYEKAYRWKCGSLAELAIGKLKHSMAERLYGDNNVEAALDLQEEAYTWFEGAAEDCAHAKVMIALYHLKGWGRKPCDPTKGFDMLMCLVPENNELAWVEVALCYDQGVGVAQDVNKALVYWEMAANAGDDLVALRRVEEIYRFGLAGAVDLEKANAYGACADMIERTKQNEREKSFCSSLSSSSSSSYASRRSSLNSLNQLY